MDFLNTDDVFVLGKSSEVDVFLPGKLCRSRRSISPLVFQVTHQGRYQDDGHMCSCSTGLAVFLAVEEHRVSSLNAQRQDERFQDVHHVYLPATAKDMVGRVLLLGSSAT